MTTQGEHKMRTLPARVAPYKRTPTFTHLSTPAALQKDHRTKAGTWGVLNIERGQLLYHITHCDPPQTYLLNPENSGVIEPGQLHHVGFDGEVAFHVQFYR